MSVARSRASVAAEAFRHFDFLCLPSFDSPSVFAAFLDGAARKQLYLPDTNVLLTRFLDVDGVAAVSDFMLVEDVALLLRFRSRCPL